MDRLTEYDYLAGVPTGDLKMGVDERQAFDRLASYEDTGLEPEDILSAADIAKIACALRELNAYKDIGPIDHLRELVLAEKEGRLYITPKGDSGLREVPYKPWTSQWFGVKSWR